VSQSTGAGKTIQDLASVDVKLGEKKWSTTMKRNVEQLETEVLKTLELLDQMPEVQPSSRFRAQLMQRIETMQPASGSSMAIGVAFSPKVAFLALLLMLNIASAMLLFTSSQTPQQASSASGTLADSFSEDYGGPALSYYDDQSALGH
jgi:hypothetical protein